jgi:hypothetical protein
MCKRNVFVFLASCDGQSGGMDPWCLQIRGLDEGL